MSLAVHGAEVCFLSSGLLSTQDNPNFLFLINQLFFSPPLPVTPPSVQPVSPPMAVSTSLAADLEGLTLTDSALVPSVSWRRT